MTLRATIAISTYYRAAECLPLVIKSICLDNVDPKTIELIILDDCCPTPKEVIDGILAGYNDIFGNIAYIRNAVRQGFRKSFLLKSAIEIAQGNVIVFLDGDCVFYEGALERMVVAAEERDSLCQGQRVYLSSESITWGNQHLGDISDFTILKEHFLLNNTKTRKSKKRHRESIKMQSRGIPGRFLHASGYLMSVKTILARRVGMNTHALRGYMEDTDFAERLWTIAGADLFELRATGVLHLFENH